MEVIRLLPILPEPVYALCCDSRCKGSFADEGIGYSVFLKVKCVCTWLRPGSHD